MKLQMMFGQHRVRRQQGVEEVSVKGCGTVSNSCCRSHGLISAPAHPVSPTLSSHFFTPPSHFSSITYFPQSFCLHSHSLFNSKGRHLSFPCFLHLLTLPFIGPSPHSIIHFRFQPAPALRRLCPLSACSSCLF